MRGDRVRRRWRVARRQVEPGKRDPLHGLHRVLAVARRRIVRHEPDDKVDQRALLMLGRRRAEAAHLDQPGDRFRSFCHQPAAKRCDPDLVVCDQRREDAGGDRS